MSRQIFKITLAARKAKTPKFTPEQRARLKSLSQDAIDTEAKADPLNPTWNDTDPQEAVFARAARKAREKTALSRPMFAARFPIAQTVTRARKRLFRHVRTITVYLVFPDWENLMPALIDAKPRPMSRRSIRQEIRTVGELFGIAGVLGPVGVRSLAPISNGSTRGLNRTPLPDADLTEANDAKRHRSYVTNGFGARMDRIRIMNTRHVH